MGRVSAALIAVATLLTLTPDTAAAACSPLPCSKVMAPVPHQLGFGSDHGGVPDRGGVGTGFTYVAPPRTGGGFEPSRLLTGDGLLRLSTGQGIPHLGENTLENALAVGVPASARVFSVHTTIDRPAGGTGRYEQGGAWLGIDQDNYLKLVVISYRGRIGVQLLGEAGGRSAAAALFGYRFVAVAGLDTARVTLVLRADADAGTVAGFYAVNGGDLKHVATFAPPEELLTGGARVDPVLAGARLAGVFASHRSALGPLEYRFDRFQVACHNEGCPWSTPDPGPGRPPENTVEPETDSPQRDRSDGKAPSIAVTRAAGSLRVTLRHQRSVRASRLVSRGLPVALRCSEPCTMRARLRGSRRWARGIGLNATRTGVTVGGGRARTSSVGVVRTRLKIFQRLKGRIPRGQPRRLAIEAQVRSGEGARLRLRSSVRVTS